MKDCRSHFSAHEPNILRPKKRSRSHFNDTNGRYDVRKSDLEVILDDHKPKIRRTKKRSRSHFNDTNGRYDVRKSDLEVILMIRTEDKTYEKAI